MFETRKAYRISLPEPCYEKWQEMTATEKGRFCASCQKEVIDFTQLNDAKIVDFLKTSQQGFCGDLEKRNWNEKLKSREINLGYAISKKWRQLFWRL